jgi:hypothetical protein
MSQYNLDCIFRPPLVEVVGVSEKTRSIGTAEVKRNTYYTLVPVR